MVTVSKRHLIAKGFRMEIKSRPKQWPQNKSYNQNWADINWEQESFVVMVGISSFPYQNCVCVCHVVSGLTGQINTIVPVTMVKSSDNTAYPEYLL